MSEGNTVLDKIKYVVSTCALIFSTALIMGLIFTKQTKIASEIHPALAFVCLWTAVLWLTMIEGSQGSLVGLAPVDYELFKDSHPRTYTCSKIVNTGDGLDRFLLGRQFMVVVVVFTINMSGGPISDAQLWGLPNVLQNIFFQSGLAMILFTCMVGQLNSQVNASLMMLDYINNYFALFTVFVANAIEFSGLLHASYVIQMIVMSMAGKKVESNEEPRDGVQNLFFWFRCCLSVGILGFAFVVTIKALFEGNTTVWDGIPPGASVVVFFVLMSIVGLLEGMQIAFFIVARIPAADRGDSFFAKKTCELLFRGEGRNLPGFMIGRQLCVVSCMFFVARVTSLNISVGEENIFGVSNAVQNFFNTGLLGALITTIVGSIAWQLVASAFPIIFLANPLSYVFLRLCLIIEALGICSGAWVLAWIHKNIAGFQRDEVYIGTAEERAAKNHGDDPTQLHVGAGHIVKLPAFIETAPDSLKALMKKDPTVRDYIMSIQQGNAEGGDAPVEQSVVSGAEMTA